MSQLDDFGERLAAIEERLANLKVSDLPLAPLQRKLEADWQPNGAVLLEPGSVTSELLATGAINARITRLIDNQVAGALPKAATYTAAGGHCYALFDGIGWSTVVSTHCSFKLNLDGVQKATTARFINEASSHKAFPMGFADLGILSGPHTIQLAAVSGTFDSFTYHGCIVIELPA